jgi:hypothetical protein
MVVLVPIAGLCLLGLLAGLILLTRRRRRMQEPECPPEEVQEVSEYVRVQEQVVAAARARRRQPCSRTRQGALLGIYGLSHVYDYQIGVIPNNVYVPSCASVPYG